MRLRAVCNTLKYFKQKTHSIFDVLEFNGHAAGGWRRVRLSGSLLGYMSRSLNSEYPLLRTPVILPYIIDIEPP